MNKLSIKTKLLLITGSIIFLLVVGLVWNSYRIQKETLNNALNSEINANAYILTVILEPLLDFDDKDNIETVLKNMISNSKNITGVSIYKQGVKKVWLSINPTRGKKKKAFTILKNKQVIGVLNIIYTENTINSKLNSILFSSIFIGVLMFLFSFLALSVIFEKIKMRLELLISISNKIAKGDLLSSKEIILKIVREQWGKKKSVNLEDEFLFKEINLKKQLRGKDELNLVLIEFYSMVQSLSLLLNRIKGTENSVSASAEEISSGARDIESASIQQSASMREISVTNEEVGATSKELYANIEKIGVEIKKTVVLANSGKDGLQNMKEAMNQLIHSTKSISSKLAVINSKTNKISGVSTTINKISDQTNLLSINAAIEAEKAGDYGKGFLVIAKEINHLANQTTVATQEIENMVTEMQSSVLSGVMEMDKFSGEVKKRGDEVEGIGGSLTEIISKVQNLEPDFEVVRDGMIVQNNATDQISESMGQLAESTMHTKDSIVEFKTITDVLRKAVNKLKDEILRFNI